MSGDARARRLQAAYLLFVPRFRRRRMRLFVEQLGITGDARVLDVGGAALNWQWCHPRPRVTVLNLQGGDVVGDGRRLPFRDRSFDVVFSNSTIEHVGDAADQAAFAREVDRVGDRYFVQTPNAHFPVEPHFMTPLVQFLPVGVRARVARNFTVWGLLRRPPKADVDSIVRSVRLVTPRQMRELFPRGHLHRERFLGLTKSLVAVRRQA